MGVVLQELAVEPFFTVRQVLARNADFYPAPRPVDEVIELVGLAEKADARVKTLSGGQQRRLDVGLGIVGRPELLFLDEPTTGLDPSGRRVSWDLVRHLAAEGTTVILTSHYMDEVEALADRVAVVAGGRVVAAGTPASIGGRDVSAATVRFRLPDGVSADDLPVAPPGCGPARRGSARRTSCRSSTRSPAGPWNAGWACPGSTSPGSRWRTSTCSSPGGRPRRRPAAARTGTAAVVLVAVVRRRCAAGPGGRAVEAAGVPEAGRGEGSRLRGLVAVRRAHGGAARSATSRLPSGATGSGPSSPWASRWCSCCCWA